METYSHFESDNYKAYSCFTYFLSLTLPPLAHQPVILIGQDMSIITKGTCPLFSLHATLITQPAKVNAYFFLLFFSLFPPPPISLLPLVLSGKHGGGCGLL